MAASRFAVICKYMGVEDARVMNGGFVDWNKLGLELSKDEEKAEPATDFGVAYPANPEWIETLDQVKKDIKDTENFTLVDNRTWEEFIGEETGYSYHKIAGRIEGAVFGLSLIHIWILWSSKNCYRISCKNRKRFSYTYK